ncbi:OPT oligopeptide transporter protein-domain-containing protein [Cokeromyces recurvatus]|uniref:OPT oligopeptide transporter protein-domain-containing protein n=1 Tax=Cokeromyces recurvatus TaxID=90255 RepID=UPI00221FFED2|nr:OPT oligopeptide transporter protein-domain-containing protein [Cokeromyces recurvatus]XP_051380173.1 OPT oligopeptide transporter protein-domain-containing protein [Cokeromyces recurvatus]KAI7899098.1 OPT oligopeptide transporter protein-domain-containing protein [Cokeromyces recurvatus]KAI7900188.1 OPT oligopeptide transporter protein-domain-containing protein [Cokeromyces recurvatus]
MTTPAVVNEKFELDSPTTSSFRDEKKDYIRDGDSIDNQAHEKSSFNRVTEEFHFTWRASIVGSLLGCLVAASNTYLGLKIGWTFGASLFGAIFSFAILKPLSRILPPKWGGGYFGPKENCSAQSAATTAGGLAAGFVSGIPAMYKLGLMTTPRDDAVALLLFTISCAFYGLFFAVPLRNHFVVKQDLTFPTPRAAAITILSLHDTMEGEKKAMQKARWMGFWFLLSFFWKLISFWLPFLDILHIFYYIGNAANYTPLMSADLDWGWYFCWDFPFFGAGLMTPGSTVLSFFISSVVIYGIIGPLLVQNGTFIAPLGFNAAGDTTNRFFLWPGIALMALSAFTELFLHYDSLWRGVKGGVEELRLAFMRGVNYFRRIVLRSTLTDEQNNRYNSQVDENEIFAPDQLVPASWWVSGTFVSIVFTCAIMGRYFGMPVYQSLIAVILGFILSFVGIQASGETDINPVGSIGKMSQLVFAKMPAENQNAVMKNNLMAGNISASAASQAVDMVGDLKTGQLVGASPRSQFLAQLVASFFAIAVAVGFFILFAEAYPCIIDPDIEASDCEFGLVAVTAWKNVTLLLTGNGDPLSKGSIIATIVCAVAAVVLPLCRQFLLPQKYHRYFPSISAIGISMINPQPEVPFSMFLGWLGGKIWKRVDPEAHEDLMFSAAGGLIAGQGIAAILQAVFKISNIKGNVVVATCIGQLADNCP